MRLGKPNRHRAGLCLGTVVMLSGLAVNAAPLSAQENPASASAPRLIAFDIPAQDLNGALLSFADRAGVEIFYELATVQGLRSAPVTGALTAQQALGQLLAGTGFTFRFTGAGRVVLERIAGEGAMQLDPVTVEGASPAAPEETAWGPVQGYVAKRSASATKSDTPIQETPQSISVIGKDQIEAQQPNSVTDALRYTAGVVAESRGLDNRYDWMIIRGFDASSFVYRDGLAAQGTNGRMEPYGLERIEVVKGPSSVTYGQMAPGGIVNAVTKRPTDSPLREIEVIGGSFDHREVRFDVSDNLTGNKEWSARLTGLIRESDTFVNYAVDNRRFIAGALSWKPSADTDLTVLVDYRKDQTSFPSWLPASGTVLYNPYGEISRDFYTGDPDLNSMSRDHVSVGYTFDHTFNDTWSFSQRVRYSKVEVPDFFVLSARGIAADNRTLRRNLFAGETSQEDIVVDSHVVARTATGLVAHEILLGIDFLRDDYVFNYGFGTDTGLDLFSPDYSRTLIRPDIDDGSDTLSRQVGLYAQDQMKIADKWVLSLGGRQDYVHSEITNYGESEHTSQNDKAFTWKSGLMFLSDSGISPYVSYATSFQPNNTSGTAQDGSAFTPTTAKQYEAGMKYQPPGYNSFITASLFDLTQTDVLTTDPTDSNFNIQIGEVRSRGLELEGTASLDDGWRMVSALTVMDSEITKSNNGDQGLRQIGVPRYMASLWADYTFSDGYLEGLRLGGGARYIGEAIGDTGAPIFYVPDYAVFDAMISYKLTDSVELGLNAKNLLDQEYATCRSATQCVWGTGRTVLASAKYRW